VESDHVHPHLFTIWRWNVNYNRWMRGQVTKARPIESVVLPKATQDTLISDIDDFLSSDTRDFYAEHGIPHKRSFLFHGTPGAGKTSAIQAIAGRYGRNVCYLAANPEMTDDSLKSAVEHVPSKSIIVLEDVDALFDSKRDKKEGDKSLLTFSGLLNALDGVGGCSGQIFVLTTNHRERLDPALIRNGRVDVHVEFTDASPEQIRSLYKAFYKHASDDLASAFEQALQAKLGKRSVSMAALQSFFIAMRLKSAEEAVGFVGKVVTELEEREKSLAERKAAEKEKQKAAEEKQNAKDAKDSVAKGGGSAGETPAAPNPSASAPTPSSEGEATHIHVHLHK